MRLSLAFVVAAALLSLAWVAANARQIPSGRPVIVDTDMGDDDLAAIAALFLSEVNIVAFSTANGLAHVDAGARNLARLIEFVNATASPAYQPVLSAIKIFQGIPNPMNGTNAFPPDFRSESDSLGDKYGFPPYNPSTSPPIDTRGVPALVEFVAAYPPDSLDLIAIGPLTNIASALLSNSTTFSSRIHQTIVMGGGIFIIADDTPNNASEWNIYVDPTAASIVFSSALADSLKLTMLGLDVTQYTAATPQMVAAAVKDNSTMQLSNCARALVDMIADVATWTDNDLYDVITSAYLLQPTLFPKANIGISPVSVETSGPELGRTIIGTAGPSLIVPFDLEQDGFAAWLLNLIVATSSAV